MFFKAYFGNRICVFVKINIRNRKELLQKKMMLNSLLNLGFGMICKLPKWHLHQ